MRLHYWQGAPNFGDELNLWLWPRLAPGLIDGEDDGLVFSGIGSLLNDRFPREPLNVVVGAGTGYGKPPSVLPPRWRIYAVRGPLTAETLGLAPELAVTDAAALVRYASLPEPGPAARVSFMPHHDSGRAGDWRRVAELAGFQFIDPESGVEAVISSMRGSQLLVTEALHGAVVADALRVPWIPVKAYPWILEFKWEDWCRSLGMTYRPTALPALWTRHGIWSRQRHQRERTLPRSVAGAALHALHAVRSPSEEEAAADLVRASEAEPMLSDEQTLDRATEKLRDALDRVEQDLPRLRDEARKPA